MRILSIGVMDGISNTCRLRNLSLENIADRIDVVNTSSKYTWGERIAYHLFLHGLPVRLPDVAGANSTIKQLINSKEYDVVWIDKGNTIEASTLNYIKQKQPKVKLISYSPDNMVLRHNQSQQYIEGLPYYDAIVTNKSYTVSALKGMGAKNVIFVNNTYSSSFHYPYSLTEEDKTLFCKSIGFIGAWEKERCDSIRYLVDNGLQVTVWGDRKWMKYKNYSPNLIIKDFGLYSDNYCRALQAIQINLCFLRKKNFDQQTTRSVEIPACGGFMMAERTKEHMAMFEEDKEAVYFSSNEELLEKCRYYLLHDQERRSIALAGRQRCIESDYTNERMIKTVLHQVLSEK